MTRVFFYGSIDMTKAFGVTRTGDVSEELRPFLFVDRNSHIRLNITIRNKRTARDRYTHDIVAAKKGVEGSVVLCEMVEYERQSEGQANPGTGGDGGRSDNPKGRNVKDGGGKKDGKRGEAFRIRRELLHGHAVLM